MAVIAVLYDQNVKNAWNDAQHPDQDKYCVFNITTKHE